MANLQADDLTPFVSIFRDAIAADPLKFVIFFLMVFSYTQSKNLLKFIGKRLDTFEDMIKDLTKTSASNLDKTQTTLNEHVAKIAEFQNSLREDIHKSKDDTLQVKYDLLKEVEKAKTELAEVRGKMEKYGAESSAVNDALNAYRLRVEELEKKIKLFLDVLQKRKEGASGI